MFRLRRSLKIHSKFNPNLRVEAGMFDSKVFSGGLIQSGGIIKDIWSPVIKEVDLKGRKEVLILGMGGGTLVKLLKRKNPLLKIIAVEIDPALIDIALNYFGIAKYKPKIIEGDAFKFIAKIKIKFDFIFVDLYLGDKLPNKSDSKKFLMDLKKSLRPEGLIIFNRLYWGQHKKSAEDFTKVLSLFFARVETKSVPRYFASNLMVFASV